MVNGLPHSTFKGKKGYPRSLHAYPPEAKKVCLAIFLLLPAVFLGQEAWVLLQGPNTWFKRTPRAGEPPSPALDYQAQTVGKNEVK